MMLSSENIFVGLPRLVRLALCAFLAVLSVGCATAQNEPELDLAAAQELTGQAVVQERRGNYSGALANYIAAVKLTPSAELWHEIGRMHLGMRDEMQAMSAFGNAVKLNSEHAPSLEAVGLLNLKWKQTVLSREFLERAIAADTESWKALNGLAILDSLDGRHRDAQVRYQAALEIRPDAADVLNNLGYSQFLAGMSEVAAEHLVDAVKHKRDHKVAWSNLAMVMARQGRYTDAFNILERNYSVAVAYHDVGYMALINGEYARAEDLLSKALQASPRYFEEADKNREIARNRLLGNEEGSFVVRKDAGNPYCIGLGEEGC
jgi:Flp pilus assembly protein TadD